MLKQGSTLASCSSSLSRFAILRCDIAPAVFDVACGAAFCNERANANVRSSSLSELWGACWAWKFPMSRVDALFFPAQ